jgi:hypothetical protein
VEAGFKNRRFHRKLVEPTGLGFIKNSAFFGIQFLFGGRFFFLGGAILQLGQMISVPALNILLTVEDPNNRPMRLLTQRMDHPQTRNKE